MDKYKLVLDLVEHPEKYTSEQLAEIMSDPETREREFGIRIIFF